MVFRGSYTFLKIAFWAIIIGNLYDTHTNTASGLYPDGTGNL